MAFLFVKEKSEKIFESVDHKTSALSAVNKPDKLNEITSEPNLLNPGEINHGIKFSSVFSGKNIIIHGGGKLHLLPFLIVLITNPV